MSEPPSTWTVFGSDEPPDPEGPAKPPPTRPREPEYPNPVGPYRIIEELGTGGMGIVLKGVREDGKGPAGLVAIKLIKKDLFQKVGIDPSEVLRRFKLEARLHEALGECAGIAHLIDTGATADGQSYFVMRYVEGARIDKYCAEHQLNTRERLRLVRKICDALQHAHRHGVIHRDIKPANVLVRTTATRRPEPFLMDFGIAGLLNPLMPGPEFIGPERRFMTKEYASPEQIRGGVVHEASDIYSLGVLLYELLTDHMPYRFASDNPTEVERVVCHVVPPRPSDRIDEDVARNRRESVRRIRLCLRRDIDAIVLKALDKTDRFRYVSAKEFGDAISLGLAAPYNRRLSDSNRRLSVALAEATTQRETAEAINAFLNDHLLGAPDPDGDGPDVKVLTMVDRAADAVGSAFKDRPAVEARVRRTLGETYFRIGRPEEARTQLLRAKALFESLGAANPRTIAELSYKIAETHWRGHDADEAEKAITMLRPLLADFEGRFGADDELSINARNGLAGALKWAGRLDEAESLYIQVLQSRREVLGDANADTIMTRYNLALVSRARALEIHKSGDASCATGLWQSSLDAMIAVRDDLLRVLGPRHSRTLSVRAEIAGLLTLLQRPEDSEADYLALLPAMREKLGDSHWRVLETTARFGKLLMCQQRVEEAAAQFRAALNGYRFRNKTLKDTITVTNYLADALDKLGQTPAAADVLNQAYHDLIAEAKTELAKTQADRLRVLFERAGDATNADFWRRRAGGKPA